MNKKVMLLAGGCVIVAVLFIMLVFAGGKNKNGQKIIPGGQNQENNQAEITPQETLAPEVTLSDYTSSYFNFSYDPVLSVTEGTPDAEGFTVLVKSPETFVPAFQIAIQANPSDKVSPEGIRQALLAYELQPKEVTVGGNIPATTYTDISGKRQQEVTVVSQNGYIYRIDMSYASGMKNPQIEAFYQEILSSFQVR